MVEEDTKHKKKRTKECLKRLVDSMAHHLDHGHPGDRAQPTESTNGAIEEVPNSAPAPGTGETMEGNFGGEGDRDQGGQCSRGGDYDGQGDCYKPDGNEKEDGDEGQEDCDCVPFLTRDHRMAPRDGTQPTKIPFPVDCREIRVFAFFEKGKGEGWRLFLDKAYSLGLFRKVFSFIASDTDISP